MESGKDGNEPGRSPARDGRVAQAVRRFTSFIHTLSSGSTTFDLALPSVAALVVVAPFHHWLRLWSEGTTDSKLALALYFVGGVFAVAGCALSIHAPTAARTRGVYVAVFLLTFYFGFLITWQQAHRLEIAANRDQQNKVQYDADVRELNGKIEGITATIGALAKQPGGEKWSSVLDQIQQLKNSGAGRASPAPIVTSQAGGNLSARIEELSGEIMSDLCRHGWPGRLDECSGYDKTHIIPMPEGSNRSASDSWVQQRSWVFRTRWLQQLVGIRNELAQMHLTDPVLDQELKFATNARVSPDGMTMSVENVDDLANEHPIFPQIINDFAIRIKLLGRQMPMDRFSPRPLPFSVAQVKTGDPNSPHGLLVTITPDTDIAKGYIVVEFEAPPASMWTDYPGKLISFYRDEEITGNSELINYLRSHVSSALAVEIGSRNPLAKGASIHVHANGSPLTVVKVTLFDQ